METVLLLLKSLLGGTGESLGLATYFNYWFLQTLAMLLTAFLVPNLRITSVLGTLFCVMLLGVVNATVWDAALFFQFPSSFSLQALTLFLSNIAVFWLLVKLAPGIEVEGIIAPLIAPTIFTICSLLIDTYAKDVDWPALIGQGLEFVQMLKDYLSGASQAVSAPQSPPG